MGKEHLVSITNGIGSKELSNGNYNVTSTTIGYDVSTINPATQEITEDVNDYSFTIVATGTLTLHVSDDGTDIGIPIVGATFVRCDVDEKTYGDPVVSDDNGNAVFNYVPFAEENAPIIYYKQISSDGDYNFDATLKNTTLSEETLTIEVLNEEATTRNFSLTDANYENLPISDGNIILTDVS